MDGLPTLANGEVPHATTRSTGGGSYRRCPCRARAGVGGRGSASIEAVEGFQFGIKGGKEAREDSEELAGGAELYVVAEGGMAGGGEDDVGGGGGHADDEEVFEALAVADHGVELADPVGAEGVVGDFRILIWDLRLVGGRVGRGVAVSVSVIVVSVHT